MKQADVLALFGGTFNPPHRGHIEPIISVAAEFHVPQINMLLAPVPPHKEVQYASLQQRIDMLALACQDYPVCQPDFTELNLPAPHYTIKTLMHLRAQNNNRSMVFIIGADSLANIPNWYEWQSLLDYTHIIILPRPGYKLPDDDKARQWIEQHTQSDKSKLVETPCGSLFFAETPLWDVSSTQLRQLIACNRQTSELEKFIPQNVINYINQYDVYKSST